ncbi:hypothetical protein B4Q13_19245, partial [Lacticaseibacillus rhamnosus]
MNDMATNVRGWFDAAQAMQTDTVALRRAIHAERARVDASHLGAEARMAGGGRISRVHGPFVSDEEVEKVVRVIRKVDDTLMLRREPEAHGQLKRELRFTVSLEDLLRRPCLLSAPILVDLRLLWLYGHLAADAENDRNAQAEKPVYHQPVSVFRPYERGHLHLVSLIALVEAVVPF